MKQRFTLVFFTLCFSFISCDDSEKYLGDNGEESGKIIYQKECFVCHGENGDAGESGAANLQNSMLSESQMQDVVKQGSGEMQAFSHLTDDQVKLVVSFVRNELKKKDQ